MEWFIAVVVVAILGVAAMAAAGGMGEMARQPVVDEFRQDLRGDRPLRASDLQNLRFGVAWRGYSMRQVDDLLDRLTREIADRDDAIRELVGEDYEAGERLATTEQPDRVADGTTTPRERT